MSDSLESAIHSAHHTLDQMGVKREIADSDSDGISTLTLSGRILTLRSELEDLRSAVKFYAKHEHWMSPHLEDGDCSNLVAHGPHFDGTSNGWVEAEAALHF